MAAKNPLARVKEQFGDKSKLVAAVEKLASDDLWVSRTNKDKGLAHVSNAKLLKLHATFTEVKAKFGNREKLIATLLDLEKRSKDTGLRQKFSAWPVPRLWDAFKSTTKRQASGAEASPSVAKGEGAKQSKAAKPGKSGKEGKAGKAAEVSKAATKAR